MIEMNKYTQTILVIIFLNAICFSQESGLAPDIFLRNIQQNIIYGADSPLKDNLSSDGSGNPRYGEYIINLKTQKMQSTITHKWESVNFQYKIYEGSFLSKDEKEYLFNISFRSDLIGHVLGFGLNIVYVFSKDLKPISDPFILDGGLFNVEKIIDIDSDGLSEVITTDEDYAQGYYISALTVYKKTFVTPYFRIFTNYYSDDGTGKDFLRSYYELSGNSLIFYSSANYYKDYTKFIKSVDCIDEYLFSSDGIKHIENKRNLKWDYVLPDEVPKYNSW